MKEDAGRTLFTRTSLRNGYILCEPCSGHRCDLEALTVHCSLLVSGNRPTTALGKNSSL